jgi:hypothetical protein
MPQESSDVYDELVQEFYGIDPIRRKVENVAVTRTGRISHWTVDKGYVIHQMTGTDAASEVTRLFGLTELVEVNPRTPPSQRRELIEALHARILSAIMPTGSE